MSLTDSEPNFRARASALGLADDVVEALCTNGVNTLAKYAFSSAYVPGNSDEAPFVTAMTTALQDGQDQLILLISTCIYLTYL